MAQPKGWHREDIKAAVRKRGLTLSELSRRHGYVANSATCALTRPWPALQRIIAAAIGREPHELWPQWWLPDGRPRTAERPRWKDTTRRSYRNVQKREAA